MVRLPGELAREAWKTEKLMRAYEARKKLEMMGAMMFSSANGRQERREEFKIQDGASATPT